jgi:hypothetical protein
MKRAIPELTENHPIMPEINTSCKKLYHLPLLVVLFLSLQGYGQQEKNYVYYDSLTYNLYLQHEWKELAFIGNEALSKGYDYQYMRMRLGIAFYELKNYRASVSHFEKSIAFNTEDSTALQYLYYAYIESGRNSEALLLASKHKGKLGTIPGARAKILTSVYFEGGITPKSGAQSNAATLMGPDSIYGEEECFTSQSYYHSGIQLQPLPALRIYVSGSLLGIGKQSHFSYSTLNEQGITRTFTDTILPYNFWQNEFYLSASYMPLTGLTITPAFHYFKGNPKVINSSYADYKYVFSEQNYPYTHFIISLSATKEYGSFSLGLHGSYARLTSTGKQLQAGASVTWYPFGNLNLYATTSLTGFMSVNDKRIIFDQLIGGKIAPRLWLEGSVTTGNISLYNEKNAFIVYNLPEYIGFRGSANLIFTLNSHIDLSLMYKYYSREYEYYNYSKDSGTGELVFLTHTMKYHNQNFFGGLKWKF